MMSAPYTSQEDEGELGILERDGSLKEESNAVQYSVENTISLNLGYKRLDRQTGRQVPKEEYPKTTEIWGKTASG